MREPNQVPELPGWVFIRDHPVAREIERYEPGRLRLARYVSGEGEFPDGQLAVMRLFLGDMGPDAPKSGQRWRAWVIAIRCVDEDGEPMTREPSPYILRLMVAFDTWARGRDPKHVQKWAKRVREQRDRRAAEKWREQADDHIGKLARQVRRDLGYNGTIYVLDNPVAKGEAA